MKIMLVWTDAPGHGLGGSTPAWNNDLDLVVEAGGTYYGNTFGPDGWSITGGAADIKNNTEGVFLGPIPPGAATVRVVAANINSDGLPNSGDGTDQDFALVAYNAAEEPGFAISAAPSSQEVCAPDDAVYDLDIIQIMGYTEPVTLSTAGHPAGTTVSFGANPVVPPAGTTMTVSGTGGAAYGDYSLEITGTTVDLTRGTSVGLGLFTAIPGAPALISPPDGATEVSLVPTLEWAASAQAAWYDLQIATDPGFGSVVYSATVVETSHGVEQALDTTSLYYWRVAAGNTCGDGGINTLGIWHDVWDTNNSDDEPTAIDLAPYEVVVWVTGDEFGGACGPGSAGEAALAEWLTAGGCLLISSQDYYYDRGLTAFMATYLGADSVTSDVNQTTVTGSGQVFGGMGPYGLSYPGSNWSDSMVPRGGSEWVAFVGNAGDAAIINEATTYRTTFWGFPLEAIPDVNDRADLLLLFLDWCGGLHDDCPGDLDGDGEVGVTDFLAMLAAWGPNPGHPADLNGDGEVNVTDFLELLAVWGPCP
jgi:hypothetical protein